MKKLTILAVLALVLLAACSDEELPPNPPPPGGDMAGRAIAGMAGAMPNWAAAAKNVAVTPSQANMGDSVIVSVSQYDYIYTNGYLFNSKNRVWEKFSLQGDQVQNWLKGSAIGNIQISADKFAPGDNFLVIYACAKSGGVWECNNKRWMLVPFKVNAPAVVQVIPEAARLNSMIINQKVTPFEVLSTGAEYDDFHDNAGAYKVNVVRFDAKYREPKGLVVLVHVFEFQNRQDVDKTLAHPDIFKPIIENGLQKHSGHFVAVFLAEGDHRVAFWSSGKNIIYVETFYKEAANKEVIDAYLTKYPSDLKQLT